MKKIIAAAAFAACLATPALAQDEGRKPFTGPYVGAVLGWDHARGSIPGGPSDSRDGLLYGGVIGYDHNIGGAILGIEGEYTDSDTKYNQSSVLAAGDTLSTRTDRDLYAGVRIGGQVTDNLMLYGKGGYTNARFEQFYNAPGGASAKTGTDLDGYRIGAGVETTYRGLTGRVEYRYSDYGKFEGLNTARHQVAAIVGYRF